MNTRHAMLAEAIEIITELLDGDYLSYRGEHFTVDSAKLWDVPDAPVPITVAISGAQSVEQFAPVADGMIAVEPDTELCQLWDRTTSSGNRKIGQLPLAWGPDRDEAVHRAWQQFRWFAGGWKVNAELPAPPNFHAATQFVREEDIATNIPCGPDVDPVVSSARAFWEAGFTDLAFVQIGGDDHQDGFFEFAEHELLPALRDAAPPSGR